MRQVSSTWVVQQMLKELIKITFQLLSVVRADIGTCGRHLMNFNGAPAKVPVAIQEINDDFSCRFYCEGYVRIIE